MRLLANDLHRHYESCDSTNRLAGKWAAENAPAFSVVTTDFQTAGRGRMGRVWEAQAGENLMASFILRPLFPLEKFGLIPLAAALSVVQALQDLHPDHAAALAIKWPNDVLWKRRKVCGILAETQHQAAPVVILGMGINANQRLFEGELAEKASSIINETCATTDRTLLLARVLHYLKIWIQSLAIDGGKLLRNHYRTHLLGLGEPIQLHEGETVHQGLLAGITELGALQLHTAGGLRAFHAGDVSLKGIYKDIK